MHNGCSTIRACSREHYDKFYGAPNKGPELEHLNRLFKGAQQDVSAALRIAMPEGDMPRAQQDRRCALTWPWVGSSLSSEYGHMPVQPEQPCSLGPRRLRPSFATVSQPAQDMPSWYGLSAAEASTPQAAQCREQQGRFCTTRLALVPSSRSLQYTIYQACSQSGHAT